MNNTEWFIGKNFKIVRFATCQRKNWRFYPSGWNTIITSLAKNLLICHFCPPSVKSIRDVSDFCRFIEQFGIGNLLLSFPPSFISRMMNSMYLRLYNSVTLAPLTPLDDDSSGSSFELISLSGIRIYFEPFREVLNYIIFFEPFRLCE